MELLSRSALIRAVPLIALGLVGSVACLAQALPLEYEQRIHEPGTGSFSEIAAKGDFDGDGVPDLLVGRAPRGDVQFPLSLLRGNGDGTFRDATAKVIKGNLHTLIQPWGVSADFNGDGRLDIALYESAFGTAANRARGRPILLLSRPDGTLHVSTTLADAVEAFHVQRGFPAIGPDLAIKKATAGDIDNDGDLDMWVESCGGFVNSQVCSHFAINNGDETFTIDQNNRLKQNTHKNPPPEVWRHLGHVLVDVDNDGDLDLALGQMRDEDPTHVNEFSLLLLNDGTGFFPDADRVLLPRPNFNDGFTTVDSATALDVNNDGLQDLIFPHSRRTINTSDWPGRYVQVLINKGAGRFVDGTSAHMENPLAAQRRKSVFSNTTLLNQVRDIAVGDVDRDGLADLIMGKGSEPITEEAPLVHRNDGRGQFTVVDPEVFNQGEDFFGNDMTPIDLNGDGLLDFVNVAASPGPDGTFGTADDDPSRIVSLIAQAPFFLGSATIDSQWRRIDVPAIAERPVIIVGPPTLRDREPGVVRLQSVSAKGFQVRFEEWSYLDGVHGEEAIDFLVAAPGRHVLPKKTIWEVGSFKIGGNGKWKAKRFKKRFPGKPRVFLTVQTKRDSAPVTVRARDVTKNGFEAALFEEERDQRSGHRRETVGYLAVFGKKPKNVLSGGLSKVKYRLATGKAGKKPKKALGTRLLLEEERSKDRELRHAKEGISVMTLGRGFFAQQVTDKQTDTTALRRQ